MHGPLALSRPGSTRGRVVAALIVLAPALVAAFFVAPSVLAGSGPGAGFADQRHLVEALRLAFVEYWRSGGPDLSPDLASVVDYWFRYHVVKAVLAAILLIVLVALSRILWNAFLRVGGRGVTGQVGLASGGVLVTMLALFSLAAVMANAQGAVAPLASLLPMMMGGPSGQAFADTREQVRQQLADSHGAGGHAPPALEVLISDFSRYHVAMAVIATIVTVLLIGLSVALWKGFARTCSSDGRTRRLLASFGVLSVLLSMAVITLIVANTTTAADPTPALLAAVEGGW